MIFGTNTSSWENELIDLDDKLMNCIKKVMPEVASLVRPEICRHFLW